MDKTRYTHLRGSEETDGDETARFAGYVGRETASPTQQRIRYMVLVALLGLSNIIFFSLWITAAYKESPSQENCVRPQLTFSPATDVLRYEKKRLWRDIDGPNHFVGAPRPELDKAWHDLLEPMTIRVTGDELAQFSEGDTSIALKDGSGYIAEMGAYHELHCIKRIRRYIFFDYYYHNLTAEEQDIEDKHMDHCLEYWRESVMCRGDVTLSTFFWREDGYPTSRVYTDNECVDWQALDTWARKRMVDMSDLSVLVPGAKNERIV